jgi:hypothetical protein
VGGILSLAALVLFCFDPSGYSFYPVCVFHRSTGLLCPGCGSLRALHQLLHGHLAAAFRDNALLILTLPFVGWWAVRYVVRKVRRQPAGLDFSPVWLWCALGAVILFGVLRNLPFPQLAWLAP